MCTYRVYHTCTACTIAERADPRPAARRPGERSDGPPLRRDRFSSASRSVRACTSPLGPVPYTVAGRSIDPPDEARGEARTRDRGVADHSAGHPPMGTATDAVVREDSTGREPRTDRHDTLRYRQQLSKSDTKTPRTGIIGGGNPGIPTILFSLPDRFRTFAADFDTRSAPQTPDTESRAARRRDSGDRSPGPDHHRTAASARLGDGPGHVDLPGGER